MRVSSFCQIKPGPLHNNPEKGVEEEEKALASRFLSSHPTHVTHGTGVFNDDDDDAYYMVYLSWYSGLLLSCSTPYKVVACLGKYRVRGHFCILHVY